MVGCKCLCVCWLQGREHYSGDSGFGGGPACRGVQGGLPQDSLSLPDVPVAGTGLQVGGQLECGGGIFNLHSPVPSSGPPPALCPSPWRLAAVRGGQGLGGGVWVGCAWGVSACTSCASAVCKAAVLPPHFGGGTVPWVVPLPPSPGWKVWRHGPRRGQGEMAFASLCLGIPAGTPNLDPPHRVPAFLGFTKRPCRVVGVPGQGWWWWGSSGCLGGPQGSTTEPQHPSGKGQPGQSLARHGRPGRLPAGLPLK